MLLNMKHIISHFATPLKIISTSTNIGLNVSTSINMANKEPKEVQIEFAPGAFDQFEGTQEELEALQAEILEMFKNKSGEEIRDMSNVLTLEDLEDMLESDDEDDRITAQRIISSILDQEDPNAGRNLQ